MFYSISKGRRNTINVPIDASFTPESDYILTGGSDGHLNIYSNYKERCADNTRVADLSSNQIETITEAELNPKYTMIATASSYIGLWVPKIN